MSEDSNENNNESSVGEDKFSAFKEEMDSKLNSTNENLQRLVQSQSALIESLNSRIYEKEQETVTADSELLYTDPEAYKAALKAEIAKEIKGEIQSESYKRDQQNQVLVQLVQQYPELNDQNSDLTKKAVKIYDSLSESEKSSPLAYKLAIKEAADELDIKPINKRKAQDEYDEAFVPSRGRGRPARSTNSKVDPATLAFAERLGLNINDSKVLDNLSKRQGRDFSKFGS